MRLKMIIVALSALFLLAGTAYAENVTGTYLYEMQMPGGGGGGGGGPQGPMKITYKLKADGSKLGGTVVNPMGGEDQILNGKVDGNKVSFAVKVQGMQGNDMEIKYEGSVEGDTLTLKMSFAGGGGGMGGGPGGGMEMPPIVAKRQK